MPRTWDVSGLVQYLAQAKRQGLDFDWAWKVALESFPPRGSDLIVPAPSDGAAMRLFDEQGRREESIVDAMRRFCEDAWTGAKPGLRGFSLDLFRDSTDETSSASVMDEFRMAA